MELIVDRLSKQYKNKLAVDQVSLKMHEGVYGLLGANGAGKTTLMRMMCGILKPTSGEVHFNGFDVKEEEYRDALGYLPQDFGYYPEFTVIDFLLYLGNLKGLSRSKAKEKSYELLELVSLTNEAKRKIKSMSGGMKQRLGIAQSLLNDPKILILDEPTAGLDPKERIRFRNLISQLGRERIVVLSTHIVSDIEYIAQTVLVMKDGRMIHSGQQKEILETIDGKIFECMVDGNTAERLAQTYPIINIRQEGDKTLIRLVADELPCKEAKSVTATLEDLYLYYFSEEGLHA